MRHRPHFKLRSQARRSQSAPAARLVKIDYGFDRAQPAKPEGLTVTADLYGGRLVTL